MSNEENKSPSRSPPAKRARMTMINNSSAARIYTTNMAEYKLMVRSLTCTFPDSSGYRVPPPDQVIEPQPIRLNDASIPPGSSGQTSSRFPTQAPVSNPRSMGLYEARYPAARWLSSASSSRLLPYPFPPASISSLWPRTSAAGPSNDQASSSRPSLPPSVPTTLPTSRPSIPLPPSAPLVPARLPTLPTSLPSSSAPVLPSSSATVLPSSSSAPVLPSSSAMVLPSSSTVLPSSSSAPVLPSSSAMVFPSSSATVLPSSSAAPMLPSSSATVLPSSSAPVLPLSSALVLPSSSAPVLPSSSALVLPSSSTTVLPSSSAPVLPSSSALVLPSSSAPVLPSSSAPVLPSPPQEQGSLVATVMNEDDGYKFPAFYPFHHVIANRNRVQPPVHATLPSGSTYGQGSGNIIPPVPASVPSDTIPTWSNSQNGVGSSNVSSQICPHGCRLQGGPHPRIILPSINSSQPAVAPSWPNHQNDQQMGNALPSESQQGLPNPQNGLGQASVPSVVPVNVPSGGLGLSNYPTTQYMEHYLALIGFGTVPSWSSDWNNYQRSTDIPSSSTAPANLPPDNRQGE